MSDESRYIVECDNLVKIYKTDDIEVMALQGLDVKVEPGEMVAIIGNSGSGKSTFLNMIGGLDKPTAGRLYVDGRDLFKMTNKELSLYKRDTVGFVWQNNARNLIPYLPAWQNVMTPMLFRGDANRARAAELLDMVGLGGRTNNRLHQLSGGEQQRVAIAIALANSPKLLLADEPTGSVDSRNATYIFDIFRTLNRETGLTIITVTHDLTVAQRVDRVVSIRDGKVSSERLVKQSYLENLQESGGFAESNDAVTFESHEEFAVLDRNDRVQLPAELLEEIGINGKHVKLSVDNGRIIISKPEEMEAVKK